MYTEHTQTQLLSQPLTHTHAHREDKLLSQHPQIRLHVTFPIRGFLERLNPECGEIPASKAEHRLIFLSVGSECWLAGGSATLIPDFHKIRGRAASTAAAAAAANYRCDEHTYAYAHIHTDAPSPHTHTQKRISPGWSYQSDVNPPPLPSSNSPPSSFLISDKRAPVRGCSVRQPANPRRDGERETTNEQRESQ